MKKIVMLIILFIPFSIKALDYPKVNSKYVELYDITDDKVLYELNSNDKISIASLTKIATTITAIETIPNLNEEVLITNDILSTVRWDASTAGLKTGDVLNYYDLLYASMLPSGADATNAIAISSSGSIDNFVKKMNDLVTRIGLSNTHFINVTGLDDENHYSTTDDVRKLLNYALTNTTFKAIFLTKEYKLSNGLKVDSTLKNYNKALNIDTSKILGSKTGFTNDAGYCLASLIRKNDHEILVINLHANKDNNKIYNIVDNTKLIDFIYDNYDEQVLNENNSLIKNIPINLSKQTSYDIFSQEVKKFLPNDYDKDSFKIIYDGLEELDFTNKQNSKIGTLNYYYDNELLKQDDVILNIKIEFDIFKFIVKYIYYIIAGIIIIITIIIILKKRK